MTDQTKPFDLDKLDRLYAKATDGTWAVDPENSWVVTIDGMSLVDPADEQGKELRSADDARCIAALHNAYPALSARLRQLESKEAERGGCEQCKPLVRALDNEIEGAMNDVARLRAELEAVKREREVAWRQGHLAGQTQGAMLGVGGAEPVAANPYARKT